MMTWPHHTMMAWPHHACKVNPSSKRSSIVMPRYIYIPNCDHDAILPFPCGIDRTVDRWDFLLPHKAEASPLFLVPVILQQPSVHHSPSFVLPAALQTKYKTSQFDMFLFIKHRLIWQVSVSLNIVSYCIVHTLDWFRKMTVVTATIEIIVFHNTNNRMLQLYYNNFGKYETV